jgi:hypothetical protein
MRRSLRDADPMNESPLAQVLADGGIQWDSLTREQKNHAITSAIVSGLKAGADLRTAYETVLGAGSFEQMTGALYDALRAKVAA